MTFFTLYYCESLHQAIKRWLINLLLDNHLYIGFDIDGFSIKIVVKQ